MICGSFDPPSTQELSTQEQKSEPQPEDIEEHYLAEDEEEEEEEEKEDKTNSTSMHSLSGQEMFESRRTLQAGSSQIPPSSLPGNHSQTDFTLGAPDDNSSNSEHTRQEEKWTDQLEEYATMLQSEANEAQQKHIRAAAKFKLQDRLYTFPMIVLPAVVALLNIIWGRVEDSTDIVIVGITAGLNLLFTVLGGMYKSVQPNAKKEEHFWYEALYANLATEVNLTLRRGKNFRPPADAFIKEITTSIEHMRLTAPDTERGYIFCKYLF